MSRSVIGSGTTHKLAIAVLFLLIIGMVKAQGDDIGNDATSNLKALHQGKSGIYVHLNKGTRKRHKALDLIMSHPLVDAVVISASWQEVEPRPGVYSFDSLMDEVNKWGKAGKGVVINLPLYGQSVDNPQTPQWIYDQPGVRAIYFKGGGTAKGQRIRVPAVWDEGFVQRYVEPMVEAFAKRFNGNPYVWYIMPGLGHIGNLTAQPSEDGGRAFVEAGFSAEKWESYCRRIMGVYRRNFTKTPLLLKAAGIFIKDSNHDNYRREAGQLLTEFGKEGVGILHLHLEADRTATMMRVYSNLSGVVPYARGGITRIGLGNGWPLWVPEKRRGKKATRNRDEQSLGQSLTNAFGGTGGIPEIPITILFSQVPEILVSNPKSKNYRPEVAETLKKVREHLKKNDLVIFGGSSNSQQHKPSSYGAP